MLTRTTEQATKLLIFISVNGNGEPVSPRKVSRALFTSSTYLSKTTAQLVKAGILKATRGAKGGVTLARAPEEITLLEIFEACQGLLTAGYCRELPSESEPCSFHEAMKELHDATVVVLSGWTLKDLISRPARCPGEGGSDCLMYFEGCSGFDVGALGIGGSNR